MPHDRKEHEELSAGPDPGGDHSRCRETTDFAMMEDIAAKEIWRVELLTHPQAPEFWGV